MMLLKVSSGTENIYRSCKVLKKKNGTIVFVIYLLLHNL